MLLARCLGISMMIGTLVAATPSCAQSSTLKRSTLNTYSIPNSAMSTTRIDMTQTISTILRPQQNTPPDGLSRSPPSVIDAPMKRTPYSCTTASFVCYDERRGHASVPLTKSLMPDIPGLTKGGLTLKRNSVNLRYSF